MRDRYRFGKWTLLVAVAFIIGVIVAVRTVWHLWAGWFQSGM